jgi:hypothetical protein
LSHSTSPICEGFFEIGSHRNIPPCWLQTAIHLISASWEAGISGMSHQCLAILFINSCLTNVKQSVHYFGFNFNFCDD